MNPPSVSRWMRAALFNLALVAVLGTLMRYKIAFSLPWMDQKNLLHAHSHFAFAGWITFALMVLMIRKISMDSNRDQFPRYRMILVANLFAAYGMLLSFPVQGYGPVSIFFSTMSIVVSFVFTVVFWRDMNQLRMSSLSTKWFKAALTFGVISSVGIFYLAYMMAAKSADSKSYLASVYYYLHFQYNGWFFFACMGLCASWLSSAGVAEKAHKLIFLIFVTACMPAYFLSALWLPIPPWVYIIVVVAAVSQLLAWAFLLRCLWPRRSRLVQLSPGKGWWLIGLASIALTIKLLLQLASTIPILSEIAFGFRPIVIGYLHLVLLGVITIFILGFIIVTNCVPVNAYLSAGIIVFVAGIILNEILLLIQGVSALNYRPVAYINELLLVSAFILLAGASLMFRGTIANRRIRLL